LAYSAGADVNSPVSAKPFRRLGAPPVTTLWQRAAVRTVGFLVVLASLTFGSAGVPREELEAIVGMNAARVMNFDVAKLAETPAAKLSWLG